MALSARQEVKRQVRRLEREAKEKTVVQCPNCSLAAKRDKTLVRVQICLRCGSAVTVIERTNEQLAELWNAGNMKEDD